ncbi:polysaccharide deacetylase family protein [Paraburkholderia sediminicola]|uniref:polysaccharide deacetylase family protein n=1 Tax=Paraburkholderia sediminicola TaxID=458836 RepID=UPI000EAEF003
MHPSTLLSFDDGPGPSTPALLDVLRVTSCRAMFFVLGSNLARAMDVATRAVREGHVLGNHTYSHARPGAVSDAALIDEVEHTDALIREVYQLAAVPEPVSIPLRLPYGLEPQDVRGDVLARLKRSHTGWTAILDDWRRPPPSPHALAGAMRRHIADRTARGQDVLLCLHDGSRLAEARPATVEAVRLLLSDPGWQTGELENRNGRGAGQ